MLAHRITVTRHSARARDTSHAETLGCVLCAFDRMILRELFGNVQQSGVKTFFQSTVILQFVSC